MYAFFKEWSVLMCKWGFRNAQNPHKLNCLMFPHCFEWKFQKIYKELFNTLHSIKINMVDNMYFDMLINVVFEPTWCFIPTLTRPKFFRHAKVHKARICNCCHSLGFIFIPALLREKCISGKSQAFTLTQKSLFYQP